MKKQSVVWKSLDIKGRKCKHYVFEHDGAYFHVIRRWFSPEDEILDQTILRTYKGFRFCEDVQVCLRDTWFRVCRAITKLEGWVSTSELKSKH